MSIQMNHRVVSQEEWLAARKKHLAREKELTRLRDQVSAERRELPWVKVEKNYVFDTPEGKKSLSDLFDGRSQLIVYHFMWLKEIEAGCSGCSFLADHIDGANQHLPHHDVTLIAASRGPLAKLEAYKKRMGWKFKWVSSEGSDFNFDYHVSATPDDLTKGKMDYNYETIDNTMEELPGASVFFKDESGAIYHTYSFYARGGDILINTYNYLDLMPKGRNETGIMNWMRRHDEYGGVNGTSCCA
jgi:predicted dithiol-disulfide oxidoreductase (DUF899 family)